MTVERKTMDAPAAAPLDRTSLVGGIILATGVIGALAGFSGIALIGGLAGGVLMLAGAVVLATRARPRISIPLLVACVLVIAVYLWPLGSVVAVIAIVAAIAGGVLAVRDAKSKVERDAARAAEAHAARVARVREWEAALSEARGDEASASGLDAATHVLQRESNRTNTLAIVALILGLLGGLLAIPVGHTSLNQIRRTGERGRGMALAGTVLGYVWLAALVALLVVVFVVLQ